MSVLHGLAAITHHGILFHFRFAVLILNRDLLGLQVRPFATAEFVPLRWRDQEVRFRSLLLRPLCVWVRDDSLVADSKQPGPPLLATVVLRRNSSDGVAPLQLLLCFRTVSTTNRRT